MLFLRARAVASLPGLGGPEPGVIEMRAPLRYRLADRAPSGEPRVRRQEWNRASDWARLIRNATYGAAGSPLRLHAGELTGVTLGRGTQLIDYFNVVNPDVYHLGLDAEVRVGAARARALTDDVLAPEVLGALLEIDVAPDSFPRWARSIVVGAALAADRAAPIALSGAPPDGDDPAVAASDLFVGGGPSLAWWPWRAEDAGVGLWGEVDWQEGLGRGEHLGVIGRAALGAHAALEIKGEVIWAHERYVPRYIGPLYTLERFEAGGLGAPGPAPKLAAARALRPRDDRYWGGSVLLRTEAKSLALWVRAIAPERTPGGAGLSAALRAEPLPGWTVAGFFARNLADGLGDAISLERALVATETRVFFWQRYLYAVGRWNRRWRGAAGGGLEEVPDWHVGVGAQVRLSGT